jgi:DNA-binding PadR family transcriptional regulator
MTSSAPLPEPTAFLPLKADVFTILLVLVDGDAHGYRMIKAAEERTGRRGQLQPGALYRLLKQMLDHHLVEEVEPPPARRDHDERRRYYRITPFGRAVARAEAQRMAALVQWSRQRRLLEHEEESS